MKVGFSVWWRRLYTYEKIAEFNEQKDLDQYVECMENYFIANSILEYEQKQSILLTSVSPATYKLLWNLVSLQKPSGNSFNQLVAAMKSQ